MPNRKSRLSRLLFICLPVLVASTLFMQSSAALSAESQHSHDDITEAVLNYGVAPQIASAVVNSPFLNLPMQQASSVGQWSGVKQWPLVAIHAAMLKDGRIIMWDRENEGTTSMRIYNPTTETFAKIADPGGASVFCAGFVVLPDNRVVLNGGHMVTGDNYGIVSTNIYNPATGNWSKSGSMAYARWYPTTLTLPDGRLFTMGGSITPTVNAIIPEVYNPSSGVWSQIPTASMDVPLYPRIHLLPNGKVFFVNVNNAWSRTLDLTTGVWSVATGNAASRSFSSVQYRPGKILISGRGQNTAVIDMNQSGKPSWRTVQPMAYSRYNHNLIVLPDGKVLAIGGSNNDSNTDSSAVKPAEMWDPATERWTTLPSMATPRMYHSIAMLLQDGRVLVAGGGRAKTQTNYLNAEFYSPPYLFKGTRPTISWSPDQAPYGANMTVLTPDADNIGSVVLISNPAVTHAITFNQYYVPLTFTKNDSGRLTVQIPTNKNMIPPGYYMLFLLNKNGVPAYAPIMKIAADAQLPNPPGSPATPTKVPLPSATPTNQPGQPTATPKPTNTPLPPTATLIPGAFPSTAVIDNFNRSNGAVGSGWTGSVSRFQISNNQLNVTNSDALMFRSGASGTTQEAYFTFKSINASADEIDLILKSQSNSTWGSGLIEVWYDPGAHRVQVVTYTSSQGWVNRGAAISVTFNVGDRFGAKARADGYVEVYRNSTLLGTVDVKGWTYASSGGYVGLWVINGANTQIDDFGGGTG